MKRSVRLFLGCVLYASILSLNCAVTAQDFSPASDEDLLPHAAMLRSHSVANFSAVRIAKPDAPISILRIESPNYCFRTDCVTFVVLKCSAPPCPYATAFAPQKFRLHDEPFGELAILYFYDESGTVARFGLNEHYVTVLPRTRG